MRLPPDIVAAILDAYSLGYFPMAQGADEEEFHWYDPPLRGQLSILGLHIPARLARTVRRFDYEVRIDTAFAAVIDSCAGPRRSETMGAGGTWINRPIRDLFVGLHEAGHAHSVEIWKGGALAGGCYGLAVGSAFMGESMFSRTRDASKIALVHLCARLACGGFTLLDTQFVNDHLRQFGVYEIPAEEYHDLLAAAALLPADFRLPGRSAESLLKEYFKLRQKTEPDLAGNLT
jgi:leucyl/phenylalanyl-tRNA--protein transferase